MTRTARPPKPLKIGISYALAFSPDSRSLLVSGRRLNLWGLPGRARIGTSHPLKHPSDVDISPDGLRCVVKNTSGKIAVMPVADMEAYTLLPTPGSYEGCQILHSPCGRYLVDGDWKGRLTVRDAVSGSLVLQEQVEHCMVRWLACDARRELFAYNRSPTAHFEGDRTGLPTVFVRRWPFDVHPEEPVRGDWTRVNAVAPSPDGARLAVLEWDRLSVVSLPDGRLLVDRSFDTSTQGQLRSVLTWSPDGALLGCIVGDQALLLDSATLGTRAAHLEKYACQIAISPDGMFVAIGNWSKGTVASIDQLPKPVGIVEGAQPARPA
jgi:WD40 repeat protein